MPVLELSFQSGESSLSVQRFAVEENLSSLFDVAVWARSPDPSVDLATLVGQPASFRIVSGYRFAFLGGARLWTGIVSHAAQVHADPTGLSTYFIRIAPRLWLLNHRRGYRIFQHLSIPDIVDRLLAEWRIEPVWSVVRDEYPALEYKVQYGESDFAFFCRLLEEGGITFTFPDDDALGSRVLLADHPEGGPPRASPPLPFVDRPNTAAELEYVTRVRLGHAVRPGALTIRDHDFRNPAYPLFGEGEKAPAPEQRYEQYHYRPGAFLIEGKDPDNTPHADDRGVARWDQEFGDERASRALVGERAGRVGIDFETNTVDLWPGMIFSVDHHPHPELPSERRLLVTRFGLEGTPEGEWVMAGQAVFADVPYRPAIRTPKPVVRGIQSATVVGPAGQEIHTDEFGRVRVHFPWDREGRGDETTSCWIRVNQGWGGQGYGMLVLPRIGQEILVSFETGDPDRPLVVGRVFNATNPVPYKLPDNKTISTWKSESSPEAGGFNEILFEDQKGDELVYVQAEKNLRKLVKNDETITVLHDREKLVEVNETDTTGVHRVEVTLQNRVELVGKTRTTLIGGTRRKLVRKNEQLRTRGLHQRWVGKNEDIVVVGDKRERVAEDVHLVVAGDHAEKIAGDASLVVIDDQYERVVGTHALSAGKQIHLASSEVLAAEAHSDVTLKGPGGFIRIDPTGITIKGTLVKINVSGRSGQGQGARPEPPKLPKKPKIEPPVSGGVDTFKRMTHMKPPGATIKATPRTEECEIATVEIACDHEKKRKVKLLLPAKKGQKQPVNLLEVVGATAGSGENVKTTIKMKKPRCGAHSGQALIVRGWPKGTITKAEGTSTVELVHADINLNDRFWGLFWPWNEAPATYEFYPQACNGPDVSAIVRVYPNIEVSASFQLSLNTDERVKNKYDAAKTKGRVEKRGRPPHTDWGFAISGKIKYGTKSVELGFAHQDKVRKWAAFNRLMKRAIDMFVEYFHKFTGIVVYPEFPKLSLSYEGKFVEIDESWRVGSEYSFSFKADPLFGLSVRIEILDCMIAALKKTQFAIVGTALEKIRDFAKKNDQVFEIYVKFSGLVGGSVGATKKAFATRATPSGSIEGKLKVEFAANAQFGGKGFISMSAGAQVGADTGIAVKLSLDSDPKGIFFRGTLTLVACKFKYACYVSGKIGLEAKWAKEGEKTFWEDIDLLKSPDVYVVKNA